MSWDGRFIRTRYDITQRMEKSYLEVKTKENLSAYYTNFILETAGNHLGTNETIFIYIMNVRAIKVTKISIWTSVSGNVARRRQTQG